MELGLKPLKIVLETELMQDFRFPALELPIQNNAVIKNSESYQDIIGYKEYIKFSMKTCAPIVPQALIHIEWQNILSYSNIFQKLLHIIRPKIVIHEEYYNPISMGLAHSCRKLNIPCAEYQHGTQFHHMMYTFKHIPKDGFETVPKWFITWGDRPSKELKAQFKNQNYHRVCTGGKPENIAWARGDFDEECEDRDALKQHIGNRKTILVPLKLFVENSLLEALKVTILNSPTQWIWLLRQHPLVPSNELNLPLNSQIIESQLCSKLSLNFVLSMTDHVVSGLSSVCLDAMFTHGISITFLGKKAASYYRDLMDQSMVTIANTPKEIFDSISSNHKFLHPERIQDAYITHDNNLLTASLRHILGENESPLRIPDKLTSDSTAN
jgi:hypothetical protein